MRDFWIRHNYFRMETDALVVKRALTTSAQLKVGKHIVIGSGTRLASGVRFIPKGGTIRIRNSCVIGELVEFNASGDISIGDGCTLERFTSFQSDTAPIYVGNYSTVGQGSKLWAHRGKLDLGINSVVGRYNAWIGTGMGIAVADGCDFGDFTTVDSAGGSITIASKTGFGPSCLIYGHGGLRVGSGCAVGGLSTIVAGNHVYEQPDLPMRKQGVSLLPIEIGDDVWMGAGVSVLAGSIIGDGVVVGAGAVIARSNIQPRTVVVGVPARSVRRFG